MYAHKTRVRVTEGHRVTLVLPSDFPAGDVEVIVLPAFNDAENGQAARRSQGLSVDELLAARLTPPSGVGAISLTEIEKAIADGALGRGDF